MQLHILQKFNVMMKDLKCIFCGSRITVELKNVFDTRFGIDGKYEIGRCEVCGMEQILPLPSPENLKDLYTTYYNFSGEKGTVYTRLRNFFYYSFLYRFWLFLDGDISFHDKKGEGRLLDIGCNEGRGLRLYKQNGFEAEGLEMNGRAAAEARKGGFRVYADLLKEFLPEEPYDVAVLSNVLEHSLDPKDMLSHVSCIMKPGGQVWLSCPNSQSWLRYLFGRYWINWHVPFHIVHFSLRTLSSMLLQSGLKIVSSKQITPALWVAHSIIARLFAKPGKPTRQLRNPFLIAALILSIRFLFFPILWLGNFLGRGDCLIAIAQKSN